MKFSELRLTIRSFLEKKHYFFITYFFFLLGFFVVPSIHWHNNFFYGFILFPYLVTLQLKRIQLISRSNLWILSMIFAIYMCLTLLWGENVVFKDYVYYLRRPVYLFVFLSLTIDLVLRYPKFIDCLFIFFCWVAAITAIVTLFWFYSSSPFPQSRLSFLGGQLRNPISAAAVYGTVAIVCYFHVTKTQKSYAWIYTSLSVVLIFAAILTRSRGPLIALLVTFLIGTALTRNKKLLAVVLCVMIVGGLMFFYIEGFKALFMRPLGVFYRLEAWKLTLERIKDALIFGEGISTENTFIMADGQKLHHSHSVYLGTALHGGLIGLFLLLIIQVSTLWEGFLYFLRESDFTYAALLLFSLICITTMNYSLMNHPNALWINFWLPLALLAAKKLSSDKAVNSFYQNLYQTKPKA